jgi:hypothetical protein
MDQLMACLYSRSASSIAPFCQLLEAESNILQILPRRDERLGSRVCSKSCRTTYMTLGLKDARVGRSVRTKWIPQKPDELLSKMGLSLRRRFSAMHTHRPVEYSSRRVNARYSWPCFRKGKQTRKPKPVKVEGSNPDADKWFPLSPRSVSSSFTESYSICSNYIFYPAFRSVGKPKRYELEAISSYKVNQ